MQGVNTNLVNIKEIPRSHKKATVIPPALHFLQVHLQKQISISIAAKIIHIQHMQHAQNKN